MLVPQIRAARKWGVRPTAVLMQDEHYGHRVPFSRTILSDTSWTSWDYALISAMQTIEDYTDKNGILIWEKESSRVDVGAIKKIDRFEAVKQRITGKQKYKPTPGEYFVPDLKLMDSSGEWPTMKDWIYEQIENR